MFGRMVQKEVRLHLQEARFVWVAGLFCGLVVLGMALMSQDFHRRLQAYQAGTTAERRALFTVDGSAPVPRQVRELTSNRGVFAFRPPQALGPLASGLEPATPTQIHVSDSRYWSRQASEVFYRNPLLSLFPRPDFATIVGSILSLVALFFTFDALCGEKAGGTLKLMLSTGVGRDRVLLAKWVGSMLTLGVPFLLATALGLMLLVLVVPLNGPALVRIAGIVGVSVLYLSLFVTVGLAVSTFTSRPSSSLLICLVVWVGATVVLPHLLASAGAMVAPVPTFQQVRMRERGIDRERAQEEARLARQVKSGSLSAAEQQRRQEALVRESEAQKARIDADYARRLDRQVETSRTLALASPAACLTFASADLADTGLPFYRRANEGFRQYRDAFGTYARDLKREADAGRLGADWLKTEAVPVLRVRPEAAEDAFGRAAVEVALLLAFQALVFAAAYVGFVRYDVR